MKLLTILICGFCSVAALAADASNLHKGGIAMENDKILIVLSGGGKPAVETHIGFLKALQEQGVDLSACYYRASSAGSLVAGLVLSGETPDSLRKMIKSDECGGESFDWNLLNPFSGHVYDILNSKADDELLKKKIDELKTKQRLLVTATNGINGRSYLTPGSLLMIEASMSVEESLTPHYTDHDTWEHCDHYGQWWLSDSKISTDDALLPVGSPLVDGGALNNIPTPPTAEASSWSKIYISLCVDDDQPDFREGNKLLRMYKWEMWTRNREFYDVRVSDWPTLATVVQPPAPGRSMSLLDWSKEQWLMNYSYAWAKKALNAPDKFAVKKTTRRK